MDLLASNITDMVQVKVGISTAYRPIVDLLAITNSDKMVTVEGVEVEELFSMVYEPIIETHQRRSTRFQAVNHGSL